MVAQCDILYFYCTPCILKSPNQENPMSLNKNLAVAAFAGLLAAGTMTASAAFAGEHAKAGCKGKVAAEKANCKTADGKQKLEQLQRQ
jgi:hypothetical protein